MPSLDLLDLYFKISFSATPTDFDKTGCDGLYIKEIVRVTSTNISRAEICEWKLTKESWGDGYHTNCGEIVQSILDIAGMKFCPYCSRKLRPC
jgi:hypothetical protein